MLMLISRLARTLMKSVEVDWLPLSALNISCLPCVANASSTASMQKSASSVIDTREDSTRLAHKSITAARQMKHHA